MSAEPVIFWINEGLMIFFFLLVGTELKKELLAGYLSPLRQATLPAYAAVGGMVVPALIYVAQTWTDPGSVRAVLIIGVFYGKGLVLTPLIVAVLAVSGLWLLNRYRAGPGNLHRTISGVSA